jgi:hypothetical protein
MTDEPNPRVRKPIDTSLPFNDELESSSPSMKVTLLVVSGLAAFIGVVALLVIYR